jgi:glycosyltransferase involved in cell wall biosynthesis
MTRTVPTLAIVTHSPVLVPSGREAVNRASTAIWAYEMAVRLASEIAVVVYHQSGGARQLELRVERHRGADFVGVPVGIDVRLARWRAGLDRGRGRIGRPVPPTRPSYMGPHHYAAFVTRAARDARRRGVGVVNVTNYPQWVTAFRRHLPQVRTMLHMQGNWLVQIDRDLLETHLSACDRVSGCSAYVTEAAARRFPAIASRSFTLFNGADVEALASGAPVGRPERPDPRFLFVGRSSPEKGLHVLLESFEALLAHVPEARLLVVGGHHAAPREYIVDVDPDPVARALQRFYAVPEPYEQQVQRLVGAATLERVDFLGPLPQEDVYEVYRQADVLVFPVVGNEALGMPLAEAMLSGLPVVSTAAGGTTEVALAGETAIVVPRDDPAALTDGMLAVLRDPGAARQRATRARALARERFDWDRIAGQLLDEVLALAGAHRAGRAV